MTVWRMRRFTCIFHWRTKSASEIGSAGLQSRTEENVMQSMTCDSQQVRVSAYLNGMRTKSASEIGLAGLQSRVLEYKKQEGMDMASSKEFVEYVVEQLQDAGEIIYKKMFGEYGIYCNGKIFALICDDQFFVKITDAGKHLCEDAEEVPPYEGSKPYFLIENVDNREFLAELVKATCRELPEPKSKKPRKKK